MLRQESRKGRADSMGEVRDAGREPRSDADRVVYGLDQQGGKGADGNYAVLVYDARGNGGGRIAPTIAGDHQDRVTDYTAIVVKYEETIQQGKE